MKEEATVPFCDLVLEMTHYHFCHILIVISVIFCSSEMSHSVWPAFQGSLIKLHLLTGGVSKGFHTHFKTTTYGIHAEIHVLRVAVFTNNLSYYGQAITCTSLSF